jgi:hypothetical protein
MAEKILVTGISGGGKSYSFRNLPTELTLFVRPTNKMPVPIKGSNKLFQPLSPDGKTGNLATLLKPLVADKETGEYKPVIAKLYQIAKQRGFKYIIFDDMQYTLLGIESMFKASGEYKDARKIYSLIKQYVMQAFYLADMEADNITSIFAWQKAKDKDDLVFPGVAFQQEIVAQGFFNVVLQADITMTEEHIFKTNGMGLCKSPAEMFEGDVIPNDIVAVLKAIEEFYN